MLWLDDLLRLQYLNSAGEDLLGVSQRLVLGHSLEQALPALSESRSRLEAALRDFTPYTERELSLHHANDAPVTVDCSVTPYQTELGERGLVLEFYAIDRHLRATRDDSHQAQHELSRQVVRGLAHEIKNPLGGLRGAAQLLERELPNAALKEYTRVIIGEADRLQNLVNRLLGPNRPPRKSWMSIHEPLEHVRQLVLHQLSARVYLHRDYDPSIPMLEADGEQLIQVFLNIVQNAVQAITESNSENTDGHITLRTRARRRHTLAGQSHRLVVQIDVVDNGPGIPNTRLEQIFYPMVTTRASGSGLGLSIAQSLIHAHGGVIECHSRPGETIFSTFLPLTV